ncbi:MAG: methyltransferase [Actinobacteria bacterium]|nr:MAG: methyltransferase [Actinomycetota bacterium]
MQPFVDTVVAAAVRSGDAVVDVACGTGFATRAAAAATGHSGRAVGIDLNSAMVETARTVADPSDLEISWHEASALDLPFGNGEFDAVISQQGIQFFPDVAAGLREMTRVVRAGGQLAATVWAPLKDSPFFSAETQMLVDHCGVDSALSDAVFPAGGIAQVRGWFDEAGHQDADIELVEAVVSLPPVADYVPAHLKALPWSASFFSLDQGAQSVALTDMEARLSDYATGSGIDVPFRSYLVTATVT